MSNEMVDNVLPSAAVALLNPVCKSLSNSTKCANCEMQDSINKGAYYVPLRPKTNDDQKQKQVALQLNVCPLNNLGTRKTGLTEFQILLDYNGYNVKNLVIVA